MVIHPTQTSPRYFQPSIRILFGDFSNAHFFHGILYIWRPNSKSVAKGWCMEICNSHCSSWIIDKNSLINFSLIWLSPVNTSWALSLIHFSRFKSLLLFSLNLTILNISFSLSHVPSFWYKPFRASSRALLIVFVASLLALLYSSNASRSSAFVNFLLIF